MPSGHQWSVSNPCKVSWLPFCMFLLGDHKSLSRMNLRPPFFKLFLFRVVFQPSKIRPWGQLGANQVPKLPQKVTLGGPREASKTDLISKTAKPQSDCYLPHFRHVGDLKKASISDPENTKNRWKKRDWKKAAKKTLKYPSNAFLRQNQNKPKQTKTKNVFSEFSAPFGA